MAIKLGTLLPDIVLESTEGPVSLRGLAAQKVVLFFYPADDTPTCTKEACNFRDSFSEFADAGIKVFGVSPDDLKSHGKFRTKYKLPYPLLFDQEHKLASKLGIWVEKQMFGNKYMGVERTTLVIDSKGKIAAVFPKVRIRDHHKKVLQAAKDAA